MASEKKSGQIGLWDYYDSGSEEDELPESDSEPEEDRNKRPRRGAQEPSGDFDIETLLPPEKRQKLQRLFRGKRDIESDLESPQKADSGGEINLVDSDTELLQEAAAAREKKTEVGAASKAQGRPPPVSDAAWENNQLLARMKARLQQVEKAAAQDKADEQSDSEDVEDPSPVQLRRGNRGAAAAAPEITPPQKQRNVGKASPAIRKPSVVLNDSAGHQLEVRIRSTDKMEKLFKAFIAQAIDNGWTTEGTKFKFVFDGAEVQPTATADDLQLEDGERMDVYYSK